MGIPEITENVQEAKWIEEGKSKIPEALRKDRNQLRPCGLTKSNLVYLNSLKGSHGYLVLPETLSVRLFLGLHGSQGGNSPRLFLLISSSPPWTSQVSWVTGVASSGMVFRSSLRILWLYFDGSYFRFRDLLPF